MRLWEIRPWERRKREILIEERKMRRLTYPNRRKIKKKRGLALFYPKPMENRPLTQQTTTVTLLIVKRASGMLAMTEDGMMNSIERKQSVKYSWDEIAMQLREMISKIPTQLEQLPFTGEQNECKVLVVVLCILFGERPLCVWGRASPGNSITYGSRLNAGCLPFTWGQSECKVLVGTLHPLWRTTFVRSGSRQPRQFNHLR